MQLIPAALVAAVCVVVGLALARLADAMIGVLPMLP